MNVLDVEMAASPTQQRPHQLPNNSAMKRLPLSIRESAKARFPLLRVLAYDAALEAFLAISFRRFADHILSAACSFFSSASASNIARSYVLLACSCSADPSRANFTTKFACCCLSA